MCSVPAPCAPTQQPTFTEANVCDTCRTYESTSTWRMGLTFGSSDQVLLHNDIQLLINCVGQGEVGMIGTVNSNLPPSVQPVSLASRWYVNYVENLQIISIMFYNVTTQNRIGEKVDINSCVLSLVVDCICHGVSHCSATVRQSITWPGSASSHLERLNNHIQPAISTHISGISFPNDSDYE